MKFKYLLFTLILLPFIAIAFPQLSQEDINKQTSLTNQINKDPNNVDLRFELAMEYASTGWIELGWEQLQMVPKLHENYKDIVYERYSKIILEDPNNWSAHFRLAFAYYFMDDKEKSIESFKNVLQIKPKHIWSMGLIALVYGEDKDYKQCIKWSQKALKINDDATAIHFLLGKAYYETGNYFGVLGETLSVGRLKSIEAKYRPQPPVGINL